MKFFYISSFEPFEIPKHTSEIIPMLYKISLTFHLFVYKVIGNKEIRKNLNLKF